MKEIEFIEKAVMTPKPDKRLQEKLLPAVFSLIPKLFGNEEKIKAVWTSQTALLQMLLRGFQPPPWSEEEVAPLGTFPDHEVSTRVQFDAVVL
jgi:hypothetical protein